MADLLALITGYAGDVVQLTPKLLARSGYICVHCCVGLFGVTAA